MRTITNEQLRKLLCHEATQDEIKDTAWRHLAEVVAQALSLRAVAASIGLTAPFVLNSRAMERSFALVATPIHQRIDEAPRERGEPARSEQRMPSGNSVFQSGPALLR
jgi:hypothetical protein